MRKDLIPALETSEPSIWPSDGQYPRYYIDIDSQALREWLNATFGREENPNFMYFVKDQKEYFKGDISIHKIVEKVKAEVNS